jgi:hypothetical protein
MNNIEIKVRKKIIWFNLNLYFNLVILYELLIYS